jgi:hypothetical protein
LAEKIQQRIKSSAKKKSIIKERGEKRERGKYQSTRQRGKKRDPPSTNRFDHPTPNSHCGPHSSLDPTRGKERIKEMVPI